MVFNTEKDARTKKVIKDAFFSKVHQSLYMMIRNDDDEETILCKMNLVTSSNSPLLINQIHQKVDRFEISFKDPMNIFLICQKNVFLYEFKEIIDNFKLALKLKFKLTPTIKFRSKKGETIKDKRFKIVYSNLFNKIKFFKFDKEMKYFYTHDNQLIKKCLFETGKEVYTHLDKHGVVRNLWFTKNFLFMIR